jgi:hypothetical protein
MCMGRNNRRADGDLVARTEDSRKRIKHRALSFTTMVNGRRRVLGAPETSTLNLFAVRRQHIAGQPAP